MGTAEKEEEEQTIDALLRHDIPRPSAAGGPITTPTPAYPILARPEKPQEKEERLKREREAVVRRQAEAELQAARVRQNLDQARRQLDTVAAAAGGGKRSGGGGGR